MEPISVFVSHSSVDKKAAEKLDKAMRVLRMSPFLAHADIEGGRPWREDIRGRIRDCGVLVALVTPDFRASLFTEQEVGAAWGQGKPVLAVCVGDSMPTGFIAERQRERYDADRPLNTAESVLRFALSEIYGREHTVDMLTEMLAESDSWEELKCLTSLLEREKKLTAEQIRALDSALRSNLYLTTFMDVRMRLMDLVDKCKKDNRS